MKTQHTTTKPVSFLLLLGATALGLAGMMSPAVGQGLTADAPVRALEEVGIDQRLENEIPLDLVFLDSEGRETALGSLFRGKPVLLTLVYYECPMLCTEVLNGVLRALRPMEYEVGQQLDIVTISIDPEETSVLAKEKKDLYLRQYNRPGSEDGWHFMTGDQASILELADSVGFRYSYLPQIDQYSHAAAIMLLTPEGKVSRYFFGVEYSSRDLRLGIIEATNNKIGSPIDQVLLYCYRYDPSTGKYSLAIWNLLRLSGILTIVLLATFIVFNLRRDRRTVVEREAH